MIKLNNKGQTLIMFILLIPLILVIMALVIDTSFVYKEKIKFQSVTKTIMKTTYEKKDATDFNDKIINAQRVYNLLDYKPEYIYKLSSNIEDVEDIRMKEYFEDVIDLFKKITNDINELNEKDIEEEEKEDTIGFDDILGELN